MEGVVVGGGDLKNKKLLEGKTSRKQELKRKIPA